MSNAQEMMIDIYGDISGKEYIEFIDHFSKKCNQFSFMIPHFNKTLDVREYRKEHEVTWFEYSEDFDTTKEYLDFLERNADRLNSIKDHIISHYFDIKYGGSYYGGMLEIFVVELNNDTVDFLKTSPSLNSWRLPKMLSDICFYIDGNCYFRTVAHEKMISIYDASPDTCDFIDKMGVDYCITERDFSSEELELRLMKN